jgi:hypothetical protein
MENVEMENKEETQTKDDALHTGLTDFPQQSEHAKLPPKKMGLAGGAALLLAVLFKFKAVILIILGKMKFLFIISTFPHGISNMNLEK